MVVAATVNLQGGLLLTHPLGESLVTFIPSGGPYAIGFCGTSPRCLACREKAGNAAAQEAARAAKVQDDQERGDMPRLSGLSREQARAAYLGYESQIIAEVAEMLHGTARRLIQEGVAPQTHQLRTTRPRPSPGPSRPRGFLRRRVVDPAPDAGQEPVMSADGWAYGSDKDSRVLSPDGKMYRPGDWSAKTQCKTIVDWATESLQEAVRYYFYDSTPAEGSNDSYRIRGNRFEAAFVEPFQPRAAEELCRLARTWRSEQEALCERLVSG